MHNTRSISLLCLLLLSFAVTAQTVSKKPYVIKEAGLQFDLPPDWKISKETKSGLTQHTVTSKDDAVAMVFVAAPDAETAELLWQAFSEGLRTEMKNVTSEGKREDTFNGMAHTAEEGSGESEGQSMHWSLDLLKADKPVVIFSAVDARAAEKNAATIGKFLTSIQRVTQ